MRRALALIALCLAVAGSAPAAPSKKEQWLDAKRVRAGRQPALRPARRAERVVTLRNLWTAELLPVIPRRPPAERAVHDFLRCHYTNQSRTMDRRLLSVLLRAAVRFRAEAVEVVSGYRSPKYNLTLRKKGREVARESQHVEGRAVDFRIPGVPARRLLTFLRGLRLGGVGFYPRSRFVHVDTGPVRYWRGQ